MNSFEPERELLLRYLEGAVSPTERQAVMEWLRANASARAFLRAVAEQSVMVADLERSAEQCEKELHTRSGSRPLRKTNIVRAPFGWWRWGLAVAAAVCVMAVPLSRVLRKSDAMTVRVSKVTGSNQYFGANGKTENELKIGAVLGKGDTLETRSCDAWIELELNDGSALTIAGHSTLRILDPAHDSRNFKLLRGNLWMKPAKVISSSPTFIQTPTATMETRGAQLDLQTSAADTILRVNEGVVRVRQLLDGSIAQVAANQQVAASLNRKDPLRVVTQPKAVSYWACDLGQVPEVKLGKWLPPTVRERARLGAEPLLWPIPGRDPIPLYAVALSAWSSSQRPILLQTNSVLRIRGRTQKAHTVRFGFSTQRMKGVFAGKFETDVAPNNLAAAAETWEIELPLAHFRALQPQLALTPDGLELTDVYALTVNDDAGLEINHFEVTLHDQPTQNFGLSPVGSESSEARKTLVR